MLPTVPLRNCAEEFLTSNFGFVVTGGGRQTGGGGGLGGADAEGSEVPGVVALKADDVVISEVREIIGDLFPDTGVEQVRERAKAGIAGATAFGLSTSTRFPPVTFFFSLKSYYGQRTYKIFRN